MCVCGLLTHLGWICRRFSQQYIAAYVPAQFLNPTFLDSQGPLGSAELCGLSVMSAEAALRPLGPRRFVPSADGSVCGLRSQLTSLPQLCLRIRPSWESCMGLPQLSRFRGLPIKFLTSCHLPLTPTSDSELQVSSLFPVFSAKFAAFIQNAPEHRSSTHIPNPVSLPPRCSEAAGCPVQPLPVKLPC